MLPELQSKKIFLASEPVDLRLGIEGLASLALDTNNKEVYDGSVYVFYNKSMNKIKCLTWDTNGFVLYYKKLDNLRFKINKTLNCLSHQQLTALLSGARMQLEHKENYA